MFSFIEHHSERVLCQILNSVLIHTWHCPVEVPVVWSVISQHTGTGVSQVKLLCSCIRKLMQGSPWHNILEIWAMDGHLAKVRNKTHPRLPALLACTNATHTLRPRIVTLKLDC